jgi:hypothetical protein
MVRIAGGCKVSRNQQNAIIGTAGRANTVYNQNAQTGFDTTQKDVNSYGEAVGKFNAANPYVQGGQAQTVENQQLSDTAAGLSQSAGQAVQSAAVRTGQNTGGAIAATREMQTENERALAGQEAGATERRIAAGTGYQEAGLGGLSTTANMQDTLANQQAQQAEGALSTEQKAATGSLSLGDELYTAVGKPPQSV